MSFRFFRITRAWKLTVLAVACLGLTAPMAAYDADEFSHDVKKAMLWTAWSL